MEKWLHISMLVVSLCNLNIISYPLLQLLGCHFGIIWDNFIKDFHLSCHVPISRWCPSFPAGFVGVGRMIVRKVGGTGFHSWETFHAGDDDNSDNDGWMIVSWFSLVRNFWSPRSLCKKAYMPCIMVVGHTIQLSKFYGWFDLRMEALAFTGTEIIKSGARCKS